MNFAVVLAGGIGLRMGNMERPKQYIELGNKPIIIHTIEKFYVYPDFEKVIVLCPEQWIHHTQNLIQKYIGKQDNILVIPGGNTRNETIMNAIGYIDEQYGVDEDTIIVTHDAVRPFLTHRIIEENIQAAKQYHACDTVIPATDTIVVANQDKQGIFDIPDRTIMYQGQTPQSFKAKMLRELYDSLAEEEKDILTDAAKICVMKGQYVKLVRGEVFNIKITYPYDLEVAKSVLGGE
ncbi:MAG TPA: 2-C-methyl-D-erythritol 4-phosphate cytidylyltransferase [Lachnospiraceae bacterium]|nr:2-C-methyl-D-erythritol 4-phosphate cytidylyltransferase [uncultured Lachnoclostridium sp.]HAU86256.1 2-C-methyl-D-erythritol 4-phosphate cytidylyltransferase [Lachnospiraceae bacterium]